MEIIHKKLNNVIDRAHIMRPTLFAKIHIVLTTIYAADRWKKIEYLKNKDRTQNVIFVFVGKKKVSVQFDNKRILVRFNDQTEKIYEFRKGTLFEDYVDSIIKELQH